MFSFTPIMRNKPRVEKDKNMTNGRVAIARICMGLATKRAMTSGLICPKRLGTSSPTTIDT
ncbi:hypothetical protein BMETH_284_1 [methanotrophic bacterial endosymbiont of Bathymodiolus sp.]|nr:hypothetical protein BMETH_284_1 [methanotrophic bacterial endosymbiont of Bathymodiolus sp.]